MTTKITDPLGQAFLEFCESQGIKFVDSKTGEIIKHTKEEK